MAVQDKKIPKQFAPEGAKRLPNVLEDFDVSRDKRKADQKRDWDHTVAQADEEGTTLRSGRIKLSHTASGGTLAAQRKKDKAATRRALNQVMKQLQQQLADLDRQIGDLKNKIAKFETEIEELDQDIEKTEQELAEAFGPDWKEKIKRGELDMTHPLIQQWMMQNQEREQKQTQKSEHERERDKLETKRAEIEGQLETLHEERKLAQRDGDDLEAGKITEEAIQLADERNQIRNQQVGLEKHDDVQNKAELIAHSERDGNSISTHEEVGAFMKEYAQAQKIENTLERLAREKELVEGLSEEAAEDVSWAETTEHLFEEKYFEPLEQKGGGTSVTELAQNGSNPTASLG